MLQRMGGGGEAATDGGAAAHWLACSVHGGGPLGPHQPNPLWHSVRHSFEVHLQPALTQSAQPLAVSG